MAVVGLDKHNCYYIIIIMCSQIVSNLKRCKFYIEVIVSDLYMQTEHSLILGLLELYISWKSHMFHVGGFIFVIHNYTYDNIIYNLSRYIVPWMDLQLMIAYMVLNDTWNSQMA